MLDALAGEWLDLLVIHSVGLAAIVFLVLVADRAFRLPTRSRYSLWLICLVKCLVPPFVFLSGSRSSSVVGQQGAVFYEHISVSGGFAPAQSDVTVPTVFFIAWITIGIGMACWMIVKYLKFRVRLQHARVVEAEELPEGLSGLRVSEMDVHSPFLFGVTQPTVVLPTSWKVWDVSFLSAVIEHEKSHHEARDLLVLLAEHMAVCLLWFHPAVWIIRNRLHLLREFRSDEQVLASGTIPKVHYAERLVDLVQDHGQRPRLSSVGLQSSTLGKRIHHILSTEDFSMQLNGRHHAIAFGFCLMLLPLSIGGVELPKSDRSAVDDSVQSAEAGIEFFKLKKEERPVILKHVPPVYPEQARRNKLTGKVFLRFRVAVDGTVDSVSVLKGADVFREAAIAAIRSIEFKPATSDGAPVPVWMAQVVRFDLDGVKAEGKEIQRPLMALMLNERGLLLMDGVPDKASTEVMMVELKRRLAVRDSRVVTMTANPKVSNDVLEAVIRRLRTLEIEIKVTIQ